MKSTGIVRRLDDLGRIVIPKETRDKLDLAEKEALEIFIDDADAKATLFLKKYTPGCIFCGEMEDTISFKGKTVCKKCINEANK